MRLKGIGYEKGRGDGGGRGDTPAILDWKVMEDSLYNTPPCWVIYMCGLVFQHMLEQGGIPAVVQRNQVAPLSHLLWFPLPPIVLSFFCHFTL